jgi:hypothetical protein
MALAKYQAGVKKKIYPRMTRIHMSKQRGQFLLNQACGEGEHQHEAMRTYAIIFMNLQKNIFCSNHVGK